MQAFDLHTHTCFCDGKNTPEEMVRAALAKGLSCIGFSAHSHTAFDESYCLSVEGTAAYRAEIAWLKEAYAGQIRVLCGIEQDFYSDMPTEGYDFVIGSVHYVNKNGQYHPVDESPEILQRVLRDAYGGDFYTLAEDYYQTVARVAEQTHADIIGHFDLISKFCERGVPFDSGNERYVNSYRAAIDALLPYDRPFEINTGAMSRRWRTAPYPSRDILAYLRAKGGRVILSSDAHSTDGLCWAFDQADALRQELGFPEAALPV